MGSAFGAALGAVGGRIHEQNLLNWQASYHANQGIADMLERIAPTLRAEFQPRVYQAAFQARTTPPGKKLPFNLHDIFFNHAIDQLQQQAQPSPQEGAPTATGGPMPTTGAPQGGQASAPAASSPAANLPAPPSAAQGGAKGRDDIDAQVEAATQQEQQRVAQEQQAQQAQLVQHDPTTPGVAGQGMTSLMPGFGMGPQPLTPPPGQNMSGMVWDPEHGRMAQSGIIGPEEAGLMAARVRNMEYEGQQQAELRKQIAMQRESLGAMSKFATQSGLHLAPTMDARGGLALKVDPGKQIPSPIAGSDLPPDAIGPDGKPITDRGPGKFYRGTVYETDPNHPIYRPAGNVAKRFTIQDPNSWTGFSYGFADNKGKEIPGERIMGAPNPAYGTTTTNAVRMERMEVQGPNGPTMVMVPVESHSVSTKAPVGLPKPGAPPATPLPPAPGTETPGLAPAPSSTGGASASPIPGLPPGSKIIGPKPLSPSQYEIADKQLGAANRTTEILKWIDDHRDLLLNTINAKKIQFEMDPGDGLLRPIIARNLPLSEDEATMVGKLIQAREHINTLRNPLGASGFRGPEAWNALTSLAGKPMTNPEVMHQNLLETLKSLQSQRVALASRLKGGPAANLDEGPGGAHDVATTKALATPPGKILVKEKSSGKVGTLSEKYFDPAKYERQ